MIINDKEGTVYVDNDESNEVARSLISSPFDTLKEEYEAIKKDISDNKDSVEKLDKEIETLENNIVGLLDINLNTIRYMHEIEKRTSNLTDNQRKIQNDIYNIDLKIKALDSYMRNIDSEEWFLEMKRSARRYYFDKHSGDFLKIICSIMGIIIASIIFYTFLY